MRTAIGFGVVLVVLGIVGLVIWVIGLRRAAQAIGRPTPEEARVVVDTAKKPVEAKAQKDMKEIQDASFDELEKAAHNAARPPK